ncbi:MAG: three-Cys-motif partner protein TcmP [Phycisphaerales bacterium]|nr:three-Cys-motif partner protein TcmP [Phycisphaerales bacterium]
MSQHEFGGAWTTDKLNRVRKYLYAYMTLFKGNPKARYYKTIYVDGFAGTGSRVEPHSKDDDVPLFEVEPDEDRDAYKKGSARIALEVSPSFDRYVFIELNPRRVEELRLLQMEFPDKAQAIDIQESDANTYLQEWCTQTDWRKHRAVVFLDPYGMQVEWETMSAIARTKAIDLWYLFPLGMAINRLLTRKGPPPDAWANALTRSFGADLWKQAFYAKKQEPSLFGEETSDIKDTDMRRIGEFFIARLKTIFCAVAPNPLTLRNSTGTPIYLLCFAAGNPKGAPTAMKIARHILEE